MTIINTIDLAGAALDWAVAKAAGWPVAQEGRWLVTNEDVLLDEQDGSPCSPSTDWGTGGPIIEAEKIDAMYHGPLGDASWMASSGVFGDVIEGRTPLVAAMRYYVYRKLGSRVNVPEGLAQ